MPGIDQWRSEQIPAESLALKFAGRHWKRCMMAASWAAVSAYTDVIDAETRAIAKTIVTPVSHRMVHSPKNGRHPEGPQVGLARVRARDVFEASHRTLAGDRVPNFSARIV
jgi:hypothetical protein